MTAKRVGSPTEFKTTAARAMSSGDLHILPDGRTGVYMGSQDVASGADVVLHTLERLELPAVDMAEKTAGTLANFNYTTQTLVASGGTDIGRYTTTKALNAAAAEVLLNDPGPSTVYAEPA